MLFFWTFYSSKKPEKLCLAVFNIYNIQKWFLSSKSAYYYDFWRLCDTEDCSNDAENPDLKSQEYIPFLNIF